MNTVTGLAGLVRLYARLDRVQAPIWVVILAVIPLAVALSFAELYPEALARQQLVATLAASPALTALLGPPLGDSIGALTVWRVGTIVAALVALMAALTVIRHTRSEEESGRREILGAAAVGRNAPLTAALVVAALWSVATGISVAAGLITTGEPLSGAVAFALGLVGSGLIFAAVAAVAAQFTDRVGAARGLVAGVLGTVFVIRMIADGSDASWLSWASPIGWAQQLRAYAGEQWWVVILFPFLAFLLIGLAFLLSDRRDVGSAVFKPRPGPAQGSAVLSSPLGLAWRLQGRAMLGWVIGVGLAATGIGTMRPELTRILDENPRLAAIFAAIGGERALADAFLAAIFGILAIIVAAYGIGAVLELQAEEESLRAEHVLATSVPRHRWATAHLLLATVGPAVMLVAAGVGVSLTSGSFWSELGPTVGMTLLQLPAIWVVVGITMALYGMQPRRTALAWVALVAFLLLGQLGELLRIPQWAMNLSPFAHVPDYPVSALEPTPLIGLAVVAALLLVGGVFGFLHRDLA